MLRDVTVASSYGLVVTEEHKRQMIGNKACGYIYMDPANFLKLTTTGQREEEEIFRDAKPLNDYNKFARMGDNILPPFLYIECKEPPLGKVRGHEGRHRAAACVKAWVKHMPVFLVAKFDGISQWQLKKYPNDPSKRFEMRYIEASDFPEYLVGQYQPVRSRLPLETWIDLR
jgi:hypothetical protein